MRGPFHEVFEAFPFFQGHPSAGEALSFTIFTLLRCFFTTARIPLPRFNGTPPAALIARPHTSAVLGVNVAVKVAQSSATVACSYSRANTADALVMLPSGAP